MQRHQLSRYLLIALALTRQAHVDRSELLEMFRQDVWRRLGVQERQNMRSVGIVFVSCGTAGRIWKNADRIPPPEDTPHLLNVGLELMPRRTCHAFDCT